jgi:hypothetical protein
MSATVISPQETAIHSLDPAIQHAINTEIDSLMGRLPDPKTLSSQERRDIIARYTAILEGNFIYWMTATLIAVHAEDAKPILIENLHDEVRGAHPAMLRRFAIAAHAFPTDTDFLSVTDGVTKVRNFLARESATQTLAMMAFFEGFIQKYMTPFAELAALQGSAEREYTDVHDVCDIGHTDGLFRSLAAEIAVNPPEPGIDLYEGVVLLRDLMAEAVLPHAAVQA